MKNNKFLHKKRIGGDLLYIKVIPETKEEKPIKQKEEVIEEEIVDITEVEENPIVEDATKPKKTTKTSPKKDVE